jgi:hypothetical protein
MTWRAATLGGTRTPVSGAGTSDGGADGDGEGGADGTAEAGADGEAEAEGDADGGADEAPVADGEPEGEGPTADGEGPAADDGDDATVGVAGDTSVADAGALDAIAKPPGGAVIAKFERMVCGWSTTSAPTIAAASATSVTAIARAGLREDMQAQDYRRPLDVAVPDQDRPALQRVRATSAP